ncbi:putative capsid protein [Lactobacillus phage 521B]|uniref:Putative capsid protein n=1 Tax=Lactobacillus phage 521B TaxID=2510942 RepID=A0A4Y5FEZ5_9CAUD|nr:putative capsid protein [Lactobacillus phage 521B]QBJ03430.1 putative capsid protein [Lactobacillus phage 521B]
MAKITPESIANLKSLFQDNEKALGSNFSQLIDFFNNNKVTDNGDGTFTVGAITVDASKLYNLINNSSPNILPLDNEFTGKNTFDIAPINKANGKPYITADSVPQVDLSNYPTKDQLATKADDSKVFHNLPTLLPSGTDLDTVTSSGDYQVPSAVNRPSNADDWTIYRVVALRSSLSNGVQTAFDTNGNVQSIRTWNGKGWNSWKSLATTDDVTTAVSTATANMVDSSKPTNFTARLQSGGVDVATAADLKSIEDSAWRQLDNKYIIPASGYTLLPCTTILYKIDDSNHKLYLSGSIALTNTDVKNVSVTVQLGSIVKSILTSSVLYVGYYSSAYNSIAYVSPSQSSTNLTFFVVDGAASIMAYAGRKEGNFVTYDELV